MGKGEEKEGEVKKKGERGGRKRERGEEKKQEEGKKKGGRGRRICAGKGREFYKRSWGRF